MDYFVNFFLKPYHISCLKVYNLELKYVPFVGKNTKKMY